ncbi:MAG: sensor domain-containing diguanylate cyclase [Candidatus Aminicenantes bacterium]|nr:sensor domain-containing diguanylate cyclase [Candidatus Aminicenantes bacterium]
MELNESFTLTNSVERWVANTSAFGVIITDEHLIVRFANAWVTDRTTKLGRQILHKSLFHVFPEIKERKMDVYYQEALSGQIKFLAPKFHRYLIALPADLPSDKSSLMYQRAAIYPLYLAGGEKVVGTLTYISDVTDRVLKEERLRETITVQENLIRALDREKNVNAAMAELAETLISPASLEEISNLVLEKALLLTKSPIGFAGYIEPRQGFLVLPTLNRRGWENCQMEKKSTVFKKFRGLWGLVIKNQSAVVANDVLMDHRFSRTPTGHVPIHRFLGVPAKIEGKVIGIVAVANAIEPYTEEDCRLMERLSQLHALAIYRHQMEARLYEVSVSDELTGIRNRHGFFTLAEQQLKIADRSKKGLALIFIDLDGLKEINDTMGHAQGDNALREMAGILKKSFRRADIIARIGGDEFAILASNVTKKKMDILVQKLRHLIAEVNESEGRLYKLSASIGTVYYDPAKPCDLDVLIARADRVMYREKRKKYSFKRGGSTKDEGARSG